MAVPYLISGIPVTVPVESGIVEGEPDGNPEATVTFKCAYDRRYDLLRALRGEIIWTGGSTFARMPGYPYPPSPNLICLDVPSIVGVGRMIVGPTGWPEWDEAEVTARFSVPPYQAQDGEYWSLDLSTTGEYVTLPDTSWRFVDGAATEVGAELARPMSQQQISYRAHRLPFIPQDAIDTLASKINADAYRVGRHTYPAGTLLFIGGNTSIRPSPLGLEYEVEYQIVCRPEPWNTYWHPTQYQWVLVTDDGTSGGTPPFQSADFSIIPV